MATRRVPRWSADSLPKRYDYDAWVSRSSRVTPRPLVPGAPALRRGRPAAPHLRPGAHRVHAQLHAQVRAAQATRNCSQQGARGQVQSGLRATLPGFTEPAAAQVQGFCCHHLRAATEAGRNCPVAIRPAWKPTEAGPLAERPALTPQVAVRLTRFGPCLQLLHERARLHHQRQLRGERGPPLLRQDRPPLARRDARGAGHEGVAVRAVAAGGPVPGEQEGQTGTLSG